MSNEILFSQNLVLADFSQHIHPTIESYETIKSIDLSELKSIDSAGVAYLVQIKMQYPELMLSNASAKLRILAELYGVEHIFINNG